MDVKANGFGEEQSIRFLRKAEARMPVKDEYRSGGFSDVTFYK